jgi:hypothetical protein
VKANYTMINYRFLFALLFDSHYLKRVAMDRSCCRRPVVLRSSNPYGHTTPAPDHGGWFGFVKPERKEATMVNSANPQHVSRTAQAARNANNAGDNPSSESAVGASSAARELLSPNAVRLLDLRLEYRSPALLRPAAHNARKHSKKQVQQLARSIQRFGFVNPILIADDLEIIAGHGRVEAAKMLGLEVVPTVRLSNLTPVERRAYGIADNRLAELAGWDRTMLAAELEGLLDLQFDDIESTGFSLGAIDHILDEADAKPGARVSLSEQGERGTVVSRAGDEWRLGPHRLVCGEAALVDCDVIVRRWQQFTDKTARLAGSELTFKDVQAMRLAGKGTPTASRKRRA